MTETTPPMIPDTPEAFPEPEKSKPTEEPILTISSNLLNYLAVAITFLVVGVLIGVNLPNSNDLTAADVEQIVRAALADANLSGGGTVDRFALADDDPYIGAEDAPIVIVEFSDFQCPYCFRHFERTLTPLLENYGQYIRYVYRDYAQIGPESLPAALAAQCANEQGKFWDYHTLLFQNQQQLGSTLYPQLAEQLGMNMTQFNACVAEQKYSKEVENDFWDGRLNSVGGTPSFFINGVFISGAQPYEVFEKIVLRELSKQGIEVQG